MLASLASICCTTSRKRSSKASLFFKTFQIHRALDPEKHVLVYTVVSMKLINGSPFNSISVVPTDVR